MGVHAVLKKLVNENAESSWPDMERTFVLLEYRIRKKEMAAQLLAVIGVHGTTHKSQSPTRCATFDIHSFQSWAESPAGMRWRWNGILRLVREAILFAQPTPEQGPEWAKLEFYIAAALTINSQLDKAQVEDRINKMKVIVNETIEESVKNAMRSRTVRETAGDFLATFSVRLRSLSPKKSRKTGVPTNSGWLKHLSLGGSERRVSLTPPASPSSVADPMKRMNL